jgi:hypothetical protein
MDMEGLIFEGLFMGFDCVKFVVRLLNFYFLFWFLDFCIG